jgi:hypothetical protein
VVGEGTAVKAVSAGWLWAIAKAALVSSISAVGGSASSISAVGGRQPRTATTFLTLTGLPSCWNLACSV